MIGILIATHGNFGKEILKSAELILGKQDKVLTLGLNLGDNIDAFCEKVKASIEELNEKEGVLMFTDIFGASPYNAAARNANKINDVKYRCITGINLPMLLEALTTRQTYDLGELVDKCMEAGTSGVRELFKEINEFDKRNDN